MTVDGETAWIWADLRAEREEYGPYVFNLGDEPASPDRIGWWWTKARARSGIDERWRLHDLRHFSATIAISEGHDVRTVAHRLGHADPAMTLRVYAHAVASVDQAVADSLGRVLQGLPGGPTHRPAENKGRARTPSASSAPRGVVAGTPRSDVVQNAGSAVARSELAKIRCGQWRTFGRTPTAGLQSAYPSIGTPSAAWFIDGVRQRTERSVAFE
ncbi:MAG: hypothetical protein NVSMB4_03290 [Acidimicrobiales bacterium]